MSWHPAQGSEPCSRAAALELEATRWVSAGRPDHAAHLYAAALDLEPGNTRARLRLAECLVQCSHPGAAAGEYLRVAQDYLARRRDREALAIAYRVLHLDVSQIVYVAVADMFRRIGREARALCASAAQAHLAAGRVTDGLHMLRLGAEIDARNPDVRRQLAALYRSQHMISDAVVHLGEAGRLLREAGNNAGFIEVAEQLLDLDPRHIETLQELSRAYLRVGEPRRAVVRLADLMRVSPGNVIGYEILAHSFAAIGRSSTALSVLERLASELRGSGRAVQASALLERARGWRPDDPDFSAAVVALARRPRATAGPPPVPARAAKAMPAGRNAEATVVLDIADLLAGSGPAPHATTAAEADEVAMLDASDLVEIEEAENTVVLRVSDLSHVGPAPRRRPPPRRVPPTVPPRRIAAPGRPPAPPPRRACPPPPTAPAPASTIATSSPPPRVTELAFDDDSGEMDPLGPDDGETRRRRGMPKLPAPPPRLAPGRRSGLSS